MPRTATVTLQQVAAELQISVRTARRRVADGSIPATRFGVFWRIPASFIDELRGAPASGSPDDSLTLPPRTIRHAEKAQAPAGNPYTH
jgi:excisionase family DNA binding protein